jgi:protein gp37
LGDKTGIQWTDATWNPTVGCSVLSPGCKRCYAMRMAARIEAMGGVGGARYAGLTIPTKAGPIWNGTVRLAEDALSLPLRWTKPRMIFVNSMSDLFHESLPDEAIDRVFAVMALAPQHTFQILTKRAERMRDYVETMERCFHGSPETFARRWGQAAVDVTYSPCAAGAIEDVAFPLPNVWLGVSVEDQPNADERIPDLLATPAAVRFLSCEPLLGPVDLTRWTANLCPNCLHPECSPTLRADSAEVFSRCGSFVMETPRSLIDWVIVGGESGPGARPMHPDWARSLRDRCAAAEVPFFFKQWGEWAPGEAFGAIEDGPVMTRTGDVRDWMKRYVICADRADRLDGHSFTEHATDLVYRVGKHRAGRLLDGVEHNGAPT